MFASNRKPKSLAEAAKTSKVTKASEPEKADPTPSATKKVTKLSDRDAEILKIANDLERSVMTSAVPSEDAHKAVKSLRELVSR